MTRTVEDAVCAPCARRTWLLQRLSGHLQIARSAIGELLAVGDEDLIAAVAGAHADAVRTELSGLDVGALAARRASAGIDAVCRCADAYPERLRELPCPPAVLHVLGAAARLRAALAAGTVAVVGSRRASPYGREATRVVAGECARAGLTVVSGLALGVDGQAHEAALAAEGLTVAVMPGGADRAYPAAHGALHRRVAARGAVVSELGPGVRPRSWMFPARNRIVAALAGMTVVVQAGDGSGALLTADWASRLHRAVGAVPGPIVQELSTGPNRLLREGSSVVTGAGDVLDRLFGVGVRPVGGRPRTTPAAPLADVLGALADGHTAEQACRRAGLDVAAGLSALTSLELSGHVRRTSGGGYVVAR